MAVYQTPQSCDQKRCSYRPYRRSFSPRCSWRQDGVGLWAQRFAPRWYGRWWL
jgi:hypothetical protein